MSSATNEDREKIRLVLEVYFRKAGLSWGGRTVNDAVATELALMIIATKKCSDVVSHVAISITGVSGIMGKGILKKLAEKFTKSLIMKMDSELSVTCIRVIVAARQSKFVIASLTGKN